jgi:hypothetical protein
MTFSSNRPSIHVISFDPVFLCRAADNHNPTVLWSSSCESALTEFSACQSGESAAADSISPIICFNRAHHRFTIPPQEFPELVN